MGRQHLHAEAGEQSAVQRLREISLKGKNDVLKQNLAVQPNKYV